MTKKILKIFFKSLLAIIVLAVLAWFSFLGWEYITGGKYVDYLKNNNETVELNEPFSFEIMESDLMKSKLVMVGEIHGLNEPTKFDVRFFKYLYRNYGVRTYFAELDCAQAALMNEYLETGEEKLLHSILKKWVVVQGRENKDYYDKYKAFHVFYKQLPEGEKFRFIGVDMIQDWNVMAMYVNRLSETDSTLLPIVYEKETVVDAVKERLRYLVTNDTLNPELKFEFDHLLRNIDYKTEKVRREKVMFDNFYALYKHFGLSSQKVYAWFGVYHIFQYRINGHHPLASLIRQSDLGLANNMITMNFMFVDSYMTLKSNMLPEFMQSGGKYSKAPVSSDNIIFMYIYGIRDFKRLTGENQKSIIKMNGENNPYAYSSRLAHTYQLLPVVPKFEFSDKGKPYVQYSIFVRNSDWAEPIEN